AGLHPHAHLLPGQRTIKLLGLGAVAQPSFFISSRLIVKDRDLLKSRMKITAYNQHDVGSFSESLGLVRSYHRTRRDRANVVMQSSEARNLDRARICRLRNRARVSGGKLAKRAPGGMIFGLNWRGLAACSGREQGVGFSG